MDGLAALDLILQRLMGGAGASDIHDLVAPPKLAVTEVNEVLTAAAQGGAPALQRLQHIPVLKCAAALHALCADVDPPLFSKKLAAKVNKAVRTNRSNPRVSVSQMLLGTPAKADGAAEGQYSTRAATFVSQLLALLAAVGLADGSASPLAIAKAWAPSLGLEMTTVQLLLAHGLMIGAASLCSDNTAFHCACLIGDACVDCVELLVRAGCDTSLRAKNGETGKDIAERLGNTAVLYKLRSLMLENMPAELPTVALL